ncbi:MAG: Rpn family recombination-promoting nuclease/putative transposase [Myxococcales bacterium]|nr:Rpn family recombination-promoting nuclease/putative transposase [Myxococcales bacterium]
MQRSAPCGRDGEVGRLDPKLDVVFKLLLTRAPVLLLDMVQAVLARPVRALDILDPSIPGELSSDKQVVLDIRAVLDDGARVDLEMQMRTRPALAERIVFYSARDYADQLRSGDGYGRLTPTVGILWMVEPLVAELDRFHSIFELRERHANVRLSDQLAIHVLQLSCFSPTGASGYTGAVERWARFFLARDDDELDGLAAEDPIMATAKETLDQLSLDPTARRLAREREDALKLYQMHLAASRAEGEAKGRTEGEAKGRTEGEAEGEHRGRAGLLLKLLALRFGPVSASTRARIEAATLEQLDAWAERVLSAATLDDVLDPRARSAAAHPTGG